MELLLGIDLGTSYFKVGLFDAAGELKGLGRVAVPKVSPGPGRWELGMAEFWATLRRGLGEALAQAGARVENVVGVSYSSQASTFLLLDGGGRALTPLVMWTDERGAPVADGDRGFAEWEVAARTVGHAGMSGQSAVAKWRWFQHEAAEVWGRAAHVLTVSDYFTWALTGEKVGDASTAAFLGLYDVRRARWWAEALTFFGVKEERLARLLVPSGVPFAVGALDHHAAAIGSGLGRLADVSMSTGTVLAALVLVDQPEPKAGCFHGRHADGRRFWRLSFGPQGAGQLEDYRERNAPTVEVTELLAQAERPAGTAHGAAVREILERVSVTHRRLVRQALGPERPRAVLATGGGSRSALWLQINADVLGVPVATATSPERACPGAAAFAAAAAGLADDWETAAAQMVREGRTYKPAGAAGHQR